MACLSDHGSVPAIRFESTLSTIGDATILRLPERASQALPSRGQVAVRGTIGGHGFQAVLEPDGNFGHWMRVAEEQQRAASIGPGDSAKLEIEPVKEWPETSVPQDLAKALAAAPQKIRDLWQDITPMERALSFQSQLEAKIFPTQEALSDAIGLTKGQVSKLVKAATLMRQATISQLFPDKSTVPVDAAYKLATLWDRPGAKEVILKAAQNLLQKERAGRSPADLLKALLASLDRSRKFDPLQKQYNLGAAGRVIVTRNARGKVTLAFPQGLAGVEKADVVAAVEQIVKDLA